MSRQSDARHFPQHLPVSLLVFREVTPEESEDLLSLGENPIKSVPFNPGNVATFPSFLLLFTVLSESETP